MTDHVLGVSGSARPGGNSTLFLEEALKAVQGRCQVEMIALADFGPAGARRPGALEEVVEKMRACDALVLATPSHFGMPTPRLKALLDATWEDAKKGAYEGKTGAALAVHAENGGELAAAALGPYFAVHRMPYLGAVVGRASKEKEILHDLRALRDARALMGRLVDHLDGRRR